MEIVYFGFILFLFVLAVFDLVVGVSNDAVNFLNSAIGAKVARFRAILIIASIGVFVGAIFSNGMMDIARNGIFQPQMFSFNELLCIFLAVMVTDVVLLDVFNSLGMPTSTTVSMVFELLGGTFVLALIKIANDSTGTLGFAQLMNTEKALSVILGIFLSVAVAFIFGTLVQWLSRLLFTFNYKRRLKWTIGLFGGVSFTAITYFVLIKGLKGSSIITPEFQTWINANTMTLILGCFLASTVIMQFLHFVKINVFKVIILLGTFALAMAFASNDLVNFIGVPLAALSAYNDYAANGAGQPDLFMMESLKDSASTPFFYLFIAGVIMVIALATSKKAQNVVKTSVDLSRQDEGEEMFGSSRMARSLVRGANNFGETFSRFVPRGLGRWVNGRFNKDEVILEDGAAFDLVRASVNLVLAGLLIIMGTSMKLPLSTTYVTFIVAMGSSLADRAWTRESAVFRITGVLNVIGGWFITAGIAFSACALVALFMYYGGMVVMALFVFCAIFILIKNNVGYSKKDENNEGDIIFKELMATKDKAQTWVLLKKHIAWSQQEMLDYSWNVYEKIIDGVVDEDLKKLRKATRKIETMKSLRKKLRQRELVGMRRIDQQLSLEKNTWFHLGSNSGEQIYYCLKRMAEPCKEHVDNNFNPLPQVCIDELIPVKKQIVDFLMRSERIVEDRDYEHIDELLVEEEVYKEKLSAIRKSHLDRMHIDSSHGLKVSLIYLNILQESQQLVSELRHYLRAFKRLQN